MMPSSAVRPDGFFKRHGVHVQRDWIRVQRFHEIVQSVPDLHGARPLACVPESQGIAYELLPDHVALAALTGSSDHRGQLVRAAKLLAAFHAVSVSDAGVAGPRVQRLDVFDLAREDCATLEAAMLPGFFWGDCWQGNILLAARKVYFIDPLPNRWLFDPEADVASGAIDLAMLYMSVFFCHPLSRLMRLDVRSLIDAADAMLDAYVTTASAQGTEVAVRRLARLLAVRYIDTCRLRLPAPVAIARRWVSRSILHSLDGILDWRR